MNTRQVNKLENASRRSIFNRLLIFLLFILLSIVIIHDNIKINNLSKEIQETKITFVEDKKGGDEDFKKVIELKPPKIENIQGL